MKKPKNKPYTGRDVLFVKIRTGTTKAGTFTDRKKDASKKECRKPVKDE
jgi:hypothetical protein